MSPWRARWSSSSCSKNRPPIPGPSAAKKIRVPLKHFLHAIPKDGVRLPQNRKENPFLFHFFWRANCRKRSPESDMRIFVNFVGAGSQRPGHRRAWSWAAIILCMALWPPFLRGQEVPVPAPAPAHNQGLQVRSVSAYGVYYSTTLPGSGGFQATPTTLGADLAVGGSTQVGWTHTGPRASTSFLYSPSYTGRIRYSSWNALNHSLSFNATDRFAPRWELGFSVSGNLSNFEGFLFSPTTYSNVVSASASYADLSAAALGRSFNNTQLNAAMNSAPLVESPGRTLLYGERMFTSSAQSSLRYSYSPRFSVNISGGVVRSQHVGTDQTGVTQTRYLLPTTTSGNAGMGFSYSLSPRTQFGAAVSTSRVMSDLYDGYSTTSTVSLGRTFARRWFLQVHGGVGVMNPVRRAASFTSLPSSGPHPVAGGSLGFRTYSHTLLGSYDRTVSDSYGAGASTTSTSSASWRWSRPGNGWWMSSSFSWQQLGGLARQDMSSWRATAGWGRSLGLHAALLTEYVYLSYSGRVQNILYSRSQNALRVSLVWTPQPLVPR
jgi:hypothetical protein